MNALLIKEVLNIRISNGTIFAESNWIASDRYYSSGFMGTFNRASGKAHAHRDCSFVRNVGSTIGVNNFFITVPILSVLFLFSISGEFFAIFFGVYRFTCASKIDDAYVVCRARLAVYNRKAVGREFR